MELLNDVEKPGSDIEAYLTNLEEVFNHEMGKMNFMMTRLKNFQKLLKEEKYMTQKIMKSNETLSLYESESSSKLDPNLQDEF